MTKSLPAGYKFVELSNDDFRTHTREWGAKIFQDDSTMLDLGKVLSDEEKTQQKKLWQKIDQLPNLNLGVFRGEEFCGWFTGEQYNFETFYMRNSAILPQFRKQGLYTALMYEVMRRTQEMGFQILLSRHTTTNNSIIIPKLKAGFVITGLEVSDRFGTLVHLSYFFNQTRRDVMEFRAGDKKPDVAMKAALGIE